MPPDSGPLDALYETDVQTPGARPQDPPGPVGAGAEGDGSGAEVSVAAGRAPGAFAMPVLPGAQFGAIVSGAVLR